MHHHHHHHQAASPRTTRAVTMPCWTRFLAATVWEKRIAVCSSAVARGMLCERRACRYPKCLQQARDDLTAVRYEYILRVLATQQYSEDQCESKQASKQGICVVVCAQLYCVGLHTITIMARPTRSCCSRVSVSFQSRRSSPRARQQTTTVTHCGPSQLLAPPIMYTIYTSRSLGLVLSAVGCGAPADRSC